MFSLYVSAYEIIADSRIFYIQELDTNTILFYKGVNDV